MRFSIVIPVYNKKAYIGECLDSVLSQTLSDFEMILVDDGSTDGTAAICEAYAKNDPRITLMSQPNMGPSAARNTGVKEARGDYLIFLDCDDMLAEGALKAVDEAISKHGSPDAVICCIDRFITGTGDYTVYDGVDDIPESGTGDELAAHIAKKHNRFSISPCRYAINRSFYNEAGLSFKPGLKQEDELFTPLMVCALRSYAACFGSYYLYRTVEGSRNNTPTIDNKLGFITISKLLFDEVGGCQSSQKAAMLKKRGKYMFARGLMEHNEVIERGRKQLVAAAAEVYKAYPEAAEDNNSLCRLIKLFGAKRGISCFLSAMKLFKARGNTGGAEIRRRMQPIQTEGKAPMFSIIVPVYNQEDYICECLDSILAQPAEMEVIVINDGSTDGTPALCAAYAEKDPRVRVITTVNGGTSTARNVGAAAAVGDYMIFIDGDDMLSEGSLGRVAEVIRRNNEPDFVICCIERYIHETKEIKPYDSAEGLADCADVDELVSVLAGKDGDFCISSCRYAIKRSMYVEHGLSFKDGIWHDDEHFTPLMLNASKSFAVCEGSFYLYRRHEGSKVLTINVDNTVEYIDISKTLLERAKSGYESEQKRSFFLERARWLFKSGILTSIPIKGKTVAKVKRAAVAAAMTDPSVMERLPKLKSMTKLLGVKPGTDLFLRLLKLRSLLKI